jgi:hypothetical protein
MDGVLMRIEPILPTTKNGFHRYFFDVRYGRMDGKNCMSPVRFIEIQIKRTTTLLAQNDASEPLTPTYASTASVE